MLTGCGKDAAPTKPRKRRTHCILLVRHGQYESADTDEGRVLTPLGRQQASLTGQRLEALLDAKKLPPIKVYAAISLSVSLCRGCLCLVSL